MMSFNDLVATIHRHLKDELNLEAHWITIVPHDDYEGKEGGTSGFASCVSIA